MACRKVDPRILSALEESGEEYELVQRSRHQQLIVRGRVVVTLPGRHSEHGRCAENALAAVRRFLRQAQEKTA